MLNEGRENTAGFIDDHLAFCEATGVRPSRSGGEPAGQRIHEGMGVK